MSDSESEFDPQKYWNANYGKVGQTPIQRSADRIRKARPDILGAKKHECSKSRCRPLSETDLMADGYLPRGPVIDGTVWVCCYGNVHVCTRGTCSSYPTSIDGVCRITGLFHAVTATNAQQLWVKPEKRTAHVKNNHSGTGKLKSRREAPDKHERNNRERSSVAIAHSKTNPFAFLRQTSEAGARDRQETVSRKKELRKQQAIDAPDFWNHSTVDDDEVIETIVKPPPPRKRKKKRHKKKAVVTLAPVKSTAYKRRKVSDEYLAGKAECIISDLLYSSKRAIINEDKAADLRRNSDLAVKSYYASMGNTIPFMVDVLNIRAGFDMHPPHMQILEPDPKRIHYYSRVIIRAWDIVTASPWGRENPGARFENHCISVLYAMKRGLKVDGIQVIPSDTYLYSLPLRIDLHRFDSPVYRSGIINTGLNNLHDAYHSAKEDGWSKSRLVMKD